MIGATMLIVEGLLSSPWNLSRSEQIALFEAAASMIESLQTQLESVQPKWISVEERLPERDDASAGELVLCICADGDGKPCAKEIHAWHYSVVRRMAQCFTHWMPLPSTEGIK